MPGRTTSRQGARNAGWLEHVAKKGAGFGNPPGMGQKEKQNHGDQIIEIVRRVDIAGTSRGVLETARRIGSLEHERGRYTGNRWRSPGWGKEKPEINGLMDC